MISDELYVLVYMHDSYHPAMLCFLQNSSSTDWSTWGFSMSHCIDRKKNHAMYWQFVSKATSRL